jgi:hypothetical protein
MTKGLIKKTGGWSITRSFIHQVYRLFSFPVLLEYLPDNQACTAIGVPGIFPDPDHITGNLAGAELGPELLFVKMLVEPDGDDRGLDLPDGTEHVSKITEDRMVDRL